MIGLTKEEQKILKKRVMRWILNRDEYGLPAFRRKPIIFKRKLNIKYCANDDICHKEVNSGRIIAIANVDELSIFDQDRIYQACCNADVQVILLLGNIGPSALKFIMATAWQTTTCLFAVRSAGDPEDMYSEYEYLTSHFMRKYAYGNRKALVLHGGLGNDHQHSYYTEKEILRKIINMDDFTSYIFMGDDLSDKKVKHSKLFPLFVTNRYPGIIFFPCKDLSALPKAPHIHNYSHSTCKKGVIVGTQFVPINGVVFVQIHSNLVRDVAITVDEFDLELPKLPGYNNAYFL